MKTSIRREIREFFKLAVPLASAQVAQSLTGFCDTLMMGRFGGEILAAGGLASLTFFAILHISAGITMGVSPLISEAVGAGDTEKVTKLARQGFWLVGFLSVPIAIAIANLEPIMLRLGQTEATVTIANSYLTIVLWGFFPALGFAMLRGVVSGLSQTRPVMVIVVLGTLFNVAGNYVLGFGKLGLPRLELQGLAIASTLTWWVMFFALTIYILKHPRLKTYRIRDRLYKLELAIFAQLLKIGIPIGVFLALEIGLFTIVTYLMGALGTTVLAAHQIVFQTVVVVFMIPLGMSYAATVRVGHWLGQKNYCQIEQSGYLQIGIGLIFAVVVTIAMLLFPRAIVSLYIDVKDPANREIVKLAIPMLTIATVSQIPDVIQKMTYGVLQGIQDTKIPMLLSIPAFWGIGLSLGYILGFPLGWGGMGLWSGHFVGMAIAAALFLVRFRDRLFQLKLKLRALE